MGPWLVVKDIQRDQQIAAQYLREAEQTPNIPTFGYHGPQGDPLIIQPPGQPATRRDVQRVATASQQAAGAAKRQLERQRGAFVGFISTLLQGGVEQRRRGVYLFAAGVVLNGTGNVLTAV